MQKLKINVHSVLCSQWKDVGGIRRDPGPKGPKSPLLVQLNQQHAEKNKVGWRGMGVKPIVTLQFQIFLLQNELPLPLFLIL